MKSEKPAESPLHMAKAMLQQRRVADAIALLSRYAEANPRDRDGLELLGMAYFMAKDYENAKETFGKLTQVDPMYAAGWVNLGAVQNVLEDFQGATKSLRKAIQRDKRSASAYYNLAIAQKAMKMNSMAISAYREAIKLQPKMPEPYSNLGNLHIEMKSLTQAIRVLEEGLEECPDSKKIATILEKAKSIKEGNRVNAAPLGRLVDEKELAKRQIRTGKRELSAGERNEERDTLRVLSKAIREMTQPTVALLDTGLYQQLQQMRLAAVQKDARGVATAAYDEMLVTIEQLDRYRKGIVSSIAEIRGHLEQTDPGL